MDGKNNNKEITQNIFDAHQVAGGNIHNHYHVSMNDQVIHGVAEEMPPGSNWLFVHTLMLSIVLAMVSTASLALNQAISWKYVLSFILVVCVPLVMGWLIWRLRNIKKNRS